MRKQDNDHFPGRYPGYGKQSALDRMKFLPYLEETDSNILEDSAHPKPPKRL